MPRDGTAGLRQGQERRSRLLPRCELYIVGAEAAVVLADQFTFKATPSMGGGDIKHEGAIAVNGKIVSETE